MGTVEGIRRPTLRAQHLRRGATPVERLLWRESSGSRLGHKFSRQMPIGPYIFDFPCRSTRLASELDGDSHAHGGENDARRKVLIQTFGIWVIRFCNADVISNLEGVIQRIVAVLADGLPSTPPANGREMS